jgi:hypothetical protein
MIATLALGYLLASGGVLVEVQPPKPTLLLERVQRRQRWTVLEGCPAPCLRRLDPAGWYRISGEDVTTSSLFRLPSDRDRVVLAVRPGHRPTFVAGVAALGVAILLVTAASVTYGAVELSGAPDRLRTPALVTGAGGLLLALIGGGITITHRTTLSVH